MKSQRYKKGRYRMDIKRYGFKTEDYSVYMSEFKNGKYYKVSEAKGIIEDNKLMIDTLEVQEAEIKKFTEFEHIDKIRIEEGLAEIKKLREALETIIEYSSGMFDPVEVIAKEALKEKTNA